MSESNSNAFEFVLGTLSPEERSEFIARLETDTQLAEETSFWEGQLISLNNTEETLPPRPKTWQAIETSINQSTGAEKKEKPGWLGWLPWGLSLVMSFALVVVLNLATFRSADAPVDYVAVLTDENGAAKLTAVTEGGAHNMWLQWDDVQLDKEKDLQIWALSKSDHQIRSIAVISNQEIRNLKLSKAHWRLIKDADSLILTVEDKGGSVLDEPSEMIVAKGVCVRLNHKDKTS